MDGHRIRLHRASAEFHIQQIQVAFSGLRYAVREYDDFPPILTLSILNSFPHLIASRLFIGLFDVGIDVVIVEDQFDSLGLGSGLGISALDTSIATNENYQSLPLDHLRAA
ncbi:hypothetical protein CIHG_08070 [Coccidioides immitis H538.4]|uniref:Uncharacterized protein n=2 Tax=Coccidioides immitis TaxID=5501 RepID=A0A0J8RYL4_COCIT|nr:hypothetical protein CIRG_01989 [Coccidioides immitis RMSCC 2394]KMU90260.1 hypothetical protein CIHG_08070 [Coccidioides immitis H538.4]